MGRIMAFKFSSVSMNVDRPNQESELPVTVLKDDSVWIPLLFLLNMYMQFSCNRAIIQ